MTPGDEIGWRILGDMERRGSCTPEELVQRLSTCTWNQVFAAVDQLCRDGRLTLRRPSRFEYVISLASSSTAETKSAAA
ncbi:hypothetical protein FBQ96_11365 [Nitrospirales bacterium NOB]|nr:hypothetical protein [Nitrospirales bacterium NOB]